VENWQAFVPMARSPGRHAGPAVAVPAEPPAGAPAEPADEAPAGADDGPGEPEDETPAEPADEAPAGADDGPGEPEDETPAEPADEAPAGADDGPPPEPAGETAAGGTPPQAADDVPAEDLPSEADERARIMSLIGFLADYEARKNAPVHDITRYDHFLLWDAALPGVPGVSLSPGGAAWLAVDFPDLPPRPEVPAGLVALLGDSAAISPRVRPEVRAGDGDAEPEPGGTDPEAGGAEPGRPGQELISAAGEWITGAWEPFAARWAEVTAARTLHRDLFQQGELLARDGASAELAWGFGRLRWRGGGVLVDHPLITVPARVDRDEATQRIRVCPAGPPRAETRCLAGLPLADRPGFTSAAQSVGDEGVDPWDGPALRDVLRRLVRAVDRAGTLAGDEGAPDEGAPAQGPPAPEAAAVADGTWVLFLRRRPPDCLGFLERMRALYGDDSVPVPGTLRAVVSAAPPVLTGQEAAGEGEPGPLLLPLPANEEQQRILVQAQHGTGVTVQGPPGTGKSHTIANIISHYAAQGQRVLVVTGREQALRDLTAKIPAGIKDLTLSLPGTGGERDPEQVRTQIRAHVTGLDTASADERIRQLSDDLATVDRRIEAATQALLGTRAAEVERLPGRWGPMETPTRAEAARWVAETEAVLGYIDDRLTPATARPISGGELTEFVTLIAQVGVNRADACAAELPRLAAIPPARDLGRHLAKLAELRASVRSISGAVQDWGRVTEAGQDRLRGLADRCRDEMDWMAKTAGTWLSHVREQASDPLLARDWLSFGAQLSRDREDALELRALLTAHNVVIPAAPEPAFLEGLRQARERLAEGGRLGMFSAPAKRALTDCRVDGREPATARDIDLCLQAIQLGNVRRQMLTSWQNQLGRVGGPDLDAAVPEDALGPFLEDLSDTLAWPRDWAHLREDLAAAGISSPAVADANILGYLAEVCLRAGDQIGVEELSYTVDRLGNWLRSGARSAAGPGARPVTSPRPVPGSRGPAGSGARGAAAAGPVSPLWNLFADALARRDMRQWQYLREELADLHELAPAARRLRELRRRLSASAPVWAARILADPSAAGDPAEFDAAWQWRQLDSWVRAAHGGPSPARLQAQLEELAGERSRVVAGLVSERAWRQLAGSHGEAGDTAPVWIMPAARALSSFRPAQQPPFDVLVADEASQIGLDGLPLLALARQAIVIGDDKQASPENAGLSRHQVFDLLDEHLGMVPEYRTLFDPDASLYDVASQRFPGMVMLTEHFRCLPPIIAFSSTHAYNYRIIPLRDQPPRPGWAALGTVKVPGGCRNGTVNVPEADAVVDLVAGLCADPGYDGMSMGVISLLGSAQSKLIWDKLYDRVGPEVMAQRRLRSGEPANFQGDERDVIIISTVVAVDPAVPAARIAAMTSNAAMRRINVAASRARQQMWVVHSADPDGFPDGDLRGALIRHCQEAAVAGAPATGLLEDCESQFERDVVQKITARGYRSVSVQHPAGRYHIDIVVAGPHSRLAVECDGDRWQGPDAWYRDRDRQQVLERAGWTFERIRGSEFYRDPDTALLPLWRRLTELGIPAGDG
jgi:very-short-patch-repair endonuclease